MIGEIMRHIRNYFPVKTHHGTFIVKDGQIILPFAHDGQYLLLEGTARNGQYKVIQYPSYELTDEVFDGYVTELNPDEEFIALCDEIEEWQDKHGNASPLASESFNGYSYSRATNSDGTFQTWQDVFRKRLNTWRKM